VRKKKKPVKMAMSGVELDSECKLVYDEIQSKKKHRYCTFKIDEGKIRVDKIGDRDASYDTFLNDLCAKDGEADDCRYAVYDFEFTVASQGTDAINRSKLILISWCPDTARIKKKMVYSASFDSLKKAFTGVQKIVQANGMDEVEEKSVEELLQQAART
jgi:cofilin